MKSIRFVTFLTILGLVFLGTARAVLAQNTHLSDFQYQLDAYRQSYAEYQNFKSDYLAHPTLNNEQKALLSAKQTINARELAWASYVLVLSDTITNAKVDFPLSNKSVADLAEIAKYHFNQATISASIVTRADLTAFTKNELKVTATHRVLLAQAQVASKIAQLIKFQNDASLAYNVVYPKLSTRLDEISVQNGLNQVQTYSQQINDQILALTEKTNKLQPDQYGQDTFFTNSSESLVEIRANVNRLVNVIIDLDTNYVRH